jgi:P27 family predicted phage terminase small subunit
MAGPRQPLKLVQAKGKKNLTKAEIEHREATEIQAPADLVEAPDYLDGTLKKQFNYYAKQLMDLEIMSNLDVEALVRYLESYKLYREITDKLKETPATIEKEVYDKGEFVIDVSINEVYKQLQKIRKDYAAECKAFASDLGLTISSRCKLVVPKVQKEEADPRESRFGNV